MLDRSREFIGINFIRTERVHSCPFAFRFRPFHFLVSMGSNLISWYIVEPRKRVRALRAQGQLYYHVSGKQGHRLKEIIRCSFRSRRFGITWRNWYLAVLPFKIRLPLCVLRILRAVYGPCDISSNLSSLSVERSSRSVVPGFLFFSFFSGLISSTRSSIL